MKKLLSVLLCVMVIATTPVIGYAYGGNGLCVDDAWATGWKIAYMEKVVSNANYRIDKAVAHAIKTERDDVEWLLAYVDHVVDGVMEKADRCNVTVACEYVEYIIDGRPVLIDPLKVVN